MHILIVARIAYNGEDLGSSSVPQAYLLLSSALLAADVLGPDPPPGSGAAAAWAGFWLPLLGFPGIWALIRLSGRNPPPGGVSSAGGVDAIAM